ncbi:hypothetical protein [Mucilaginibacter agri]|uniref:Uncharacterized protein n=1 Tax=Mucilaginibacter agri TaxID=2695265 RepID=A0A965ZHE2_9SPHI|nr:hypothetical protein [Mucilaginibacter agri]NCD71133.1 hypothetical protein [Mucilaginibacter agri]
MINQFHQISINGRYIYCYLCLRNAIISKRLEDIPKFLKVILEKFTATSRLDEWQDGADDIMPSLILDDEDGIKHYKVISNEQALELQHYYLKDKLVSDIIECLIWLGVSNLYGGFASKITFEEVKNVIELMSYNKIELPDFSIISSCSVNENGGWGNRVDMDTFLSK